MYIGLCCWLGRIELDAAVRAKVKLAHLFEPGFNNLVYHNVKLLSCLKVTL